MAVEAVRALVLDADPDGTIRTIKLANIEIPRAITFDDDESRVETIFSVSSVDVTDGFVSAEWACYSCLLYTSPSPRDPLESRLPSSA